MEDTSKNSIKLSVVILVYNTAEYLVECFDSLIKQTLDDIEIIAVDDESTDNSLEICRQYEAKYDNFRVITQKNQGGAVAGTTGMKEAKGKYVALVDSDDFLALNAYEILYNLCEEHEADMAIGKPLRYLNGESFEASLVKELAVWEEKKVINSYTEINTLFYEPFYWNKIFRRDFIEEYDIYMPAGYLYADFLMVHKAYISAKRIAFTDEIVYFWRMRDDSVENKSAVQETASCNNFKERIRSFTLEETLYAQEKYPAIYEKITEVNLLRISFLFSSIVEQIIFRKTFIKEVQNFLNMIDDLTQYDLHPDIKLKLWLLKENRINELFYLLGRNQSFQLFTEAGKVYCNLPFFDNEDFHIPKEIYAYKSFAKEFIKNFLYIDNGNSFTFQVLIHHQSKLKNSRYSLFFKNSDGQTKYKYSMQANEDYFQCTVPKNEIFESGEKLFVGIGDSDNIIYRISKGNCEQALDIRKKLSYIVRFSYDKEEVYFQKRDLFQTLKDKQISIS